MLRLLKRAALHSTWGLAKPNLGSATRGGLVEIPTRTKHHRDYKLLPRWQPYDPHAVHAHPEVHCTHRRQRIRTPSSRPVMGEARAGDSTDLSLHVPGLRAVGTIRSSRAARLGGEKRSFSMGLIV